MIRRCFFRYCLKPAAVPVLAAASLLLVAIGGQSVAQDRLLVFAAASMSDALERIARAYENEYGTNVVLSFAGTGLLARQIEAGAPADLFISADSVWMDYASERGTIVEDSIVAIAENSLVLAGGPNAGPVNLTPQSLAAALGSGRLAIADPETVPAGRYGKAALNAAGVWASVRSRLAPMENVRIALASAARGDTPLALVYRSDAEAEAQVGIRAAIPEHFHPKIEYPAALTRTAAPQADRFLAYLTGPAAQKIFKEAGFRPITN